MINKSTPSDRNFHSSFHCSFFSLQYAGWKWTFNADWDVVFFDPTTGGEKIFKIWELSSRGNKKYAGVARGWLSANDFRLIFNQKDFIHDSTASSPEVSKKWKELLGDKDGQRGMRAISRLIFVPSS